jgi:hypothetical protein
MYGGVEIWLHSFLSSPIDRSGLYHAPAILPPGKNTGWVKYIINKEKY